MEANETTETIAVGKKNSPLEVSSRIISGIFTPFMIPFVAFFLLFFFTYLRIMPIQYKLIVLGIVYCFTILMPMLAIYLFQKINGWGIHELGHREKRFVPYALTIISYVTCLITMYKIHLPRYMSGIIVAALIVCNNTHKSLTSRNKPVKYALITLINCCSSALLLLIALSNHLSCNQVK